MFLQHHSSATPTLSTAVNKQSDDYELFIKSSSAEKVVGQLRFTYLHQSFEASIILSPSSIQVKSLYPFAGITVSAPKLHISDAKQYVHKGALTAQGHQQIIWLMLDIIHLYNLLRLKPGAIIELYRSSFADAKKLDPALVFGQVPLDTKHSIAIAKSLVQTMRLKHKYVFSNSLDLLASLQEIIAHYPQQFLTSTSNLAKLSPVLS
jgi:hypothetical protein